jgi:hypothetical protein
MNSKSSSSNSNKTEKTNGKAITTFMIKFKDETCVTSPSCINGNAAKRKTTNLSNYFKKQDDEKSMDCDSDSDGQKEILNLLGCRLETSEPMITKSHKMTQSVSESERTSRHLASDMTKFNPIFDKLPVIKNPKNINAQTLQVDYSKDFSLVKNLIPWEYVLKVNSQKLATDRFLKDLKSKMNVFDLIYNELKDKATISDRWALDPRHNKNLMFSISKLRDLYKKKTAVNSEKPNTNQKPDLATTNSSAAAGSSSKGNDSVKISTTTLTNQANNNDDTEFNLSNIIDPDTLNELMDNIRDTNNIFTGYDDDKANEINMVEYDADIDNNVEIKNNVDINNNNINLLCNEIDPPFDLNRCEKKIGKTSWN